MSPRKDGAAAAAGYAAAPAQTSPDDQEAIETSAEGAVSAEAADGEEAPTGEEPGQDDFGTAEAPDHERLVIEDLSELSARAEKADEYLDLAQRTRADFENYRKRAEKRVGEAQERGIARLAMELLPAIDNLERAVLASDAFASGSPEESAAAAESQLASGIRLVQADVLAALARVGIEPFSPTGEQFDPQLHEAVAHQPIDGAESGTVIEVYQPGYRLGDSVLRPARVLVAA